MKRVRRRKREYFKQRKVLNRLTAVAFCFVVLLAHVFAYYIISGKPFNFASASQMLTLNQSIKPLDPVETVNPVIEVPTAPVELIESKKVINEEKLHLVSVIDNEELEEKNDISKDDDNKVAKIFTKDTVTFSGISPFPNAPIFIVVHSNPFFSSTVSDDNGNWTWTNYGRPLEKGDHTIEAYSIDPSKVTGERSVLAQKYKFTVDDAKKSFNSVTLGNIDSKDDKMEDDLDERISRNNLDDTYLFNAVLPRKTEYNFGDNLNFELMFTPFAKGSSNQAQIVYNIYQVEENGEVQDQSASEFFDNILLNDGGYFLKRLKLKNKLVSGDYVMKVVAKVGKDEYYQSFKFHVSSKPVMTIGSTVVTVEKFGQVMAINVLFIVIVMTTLISVVILEFKRYISHSPIDEAFLKKKGYFTK